MQLRILVADDHPVVRAGLRTLLESRPGWQVCAEAVNGRDAVEMAGKLKPDVAVLDISMPVLNGIEATRQLRKLSPETEVLILTMHDSEQMIQQVFEAGALGYILKDVADSTLISAVEMLRRHKPFASSRVAKSISRAGPWGADPAVRTRRSRGRLTQREREIVQLLAEGKSNKEVAGVLGISVRTAETHRANIMLKLDLHSVVDLVRYAVRNRIIEG
ncbi:MAG TPA: response regulator transcription factor [Candidatus Acidoferrales bacterium]|nr:response regulator transcription factor [Candidatus Acidoferrales bacterium]